MSRMPKQDRSRETRQRLLETTLRVVSERGLHSMTIGQVAEEAGVSRGAAQHHFPTRESLIKEVLTFFFEQRRDSLTSSLDALHEEKGEIETLDMIRLVIAFFNDSSYSAAVHVWSAAANDPKVREIVLPAEELISRSVYEMSAQVLKADLNDQQTRRMVGMLLDLSRGLGLSTMLIDNPDHAERMAQAFAVAFDQTAKRLN